MHAGERDQRRSTSRPSGPVAARAAKSESRRNSVTRQTHLEPLALLPLLALDTREVLLLLLRSALVLRIITHGVSDPDGTAIRYAGTQYVTSIGASKLDAAGLTFSTPFSRSARSLSSLMTLAPQLGTFLGPSSVPFRTSAGAGECALFARGVGEVEVEGAADVDAAASAEVAEEGTRGCGCADGAAGAAAGETEGMGAGLIGAEGE